MLHLSDIKRLTSEGAVRERLAADYDNDPDKLIQAVNKLINSLLASDIGRAREAVDQVGRVFQFLPSRYAPHHTAMEARVDHYSGEHRTALKKYRSVYRRFKKTGDHFAAARMGQGMMDVCMYLGKYDEALEVGKRSLAYFRRHGLRDTAARVMINLGNVYHRLDKNRLALSYYDKAGAVFRDKGGILLAAVHFNRANIYTNLNRLEEAARLYREAALIYRKQNLEVLYQRATYSLAYLYFLGDRFTDALKTFETVYEAFEKLGDRKAVAVTRLDLVEMNIHLNQFSTAIQHGYEVIDEFRELGMRYEEAKANYFVALARLHVGDLDPAAESLQTAGRLFKREGNDLWLGMVNLAGGKLHLEAGRPGQALKASTAARACFVRSADKRRGIDADIVYVEALMRDGKAGEARRLARRLLRRKLVSYQQYCLHTLLGEHHARQLEHEQALEHYQKAVEVVEHMLTGLYPDEIRFFFVADKLKAYVGVVECLLQLDRQRDSFLTNLHALAMVNRRQVPRNMAAEKIPATLLETREQLRAQLRKVSGFPQGEHRGAAESEAFAEIEQKLWSTEQRIRAHIYPARQRKRRTTSTALPAYLGPDEMLINYVATNEGRLGAFCATADAVEYVPLGLTYNGLHRRVWELYFVLERAILGRGSELPSSEAANYYFGQLYSELMAPVLEKVRKETVIVLADGIFAQIPYMALSDAQGRRLKDRHGVRVIVNPNDLRSERDADLKWSTRHNSVFAVPSERLPMVEREAEEIHGLFRRAGYYRNGHADSGTFKAELSRTDGFVHIATHASRSSENPLFSRIVLGDGPFFPFDLFDSGIKATLVTLSGCQTAATGLYYGNSFSLAKAFYQAGSRYVLATLWPVSDGVSRMFMVEFYRALKKSGRAAEAYRSALDHASHATDNPALWSGFVLLGI